MRYWNGWTNRSQISEYSVAMQKNSAQEKASAPIMSQPRATRPMFCGGRTSPSAMSVLATTINAAVVPANSSSMRPTNTSNSEMLRW